jgi:hypothetical protein
MAYTIDKEINGTTYKAQFNGLSMKYKMRNECKVNINGAVDTDEEKMTNWILSNVIVEPTGLKIDSFEDGETLDEVTRFGIEVMNGKFRAEVNKS